MAHKCTQTNKKIIWTHCLFASRPPTVWLSWMNSFWNKLPFFKSPLVSRKAWSSCFLGPSEPFPLQVWFQSSVVFSSLSASLALENLPQRHSLWPWVKELKNSSTDFPPFWWNFSIFSSRDNPSSLVGSTNTALVFFIFFGPFTGFDFDFCHCPRLSFGFCPCWFSKFPSSHCFSLLSLPSPWAWPAALYKALPKKRSNKILEPEKPAEKKLTLQCFLLIFFGKCMISILGMLAQQKQQPSYGII